MTEDMSTIGVRLSVVFFAEGLGGLSGNPINGAILAAANGNFVAPALFSGCSVLLSAGLALSGFWALQEQGRKKGIQ